MKRIFNALSIIGMIMGFLLIIGSVGGLEQNTMALSDMLIYCTLGFMIGGISAIYYDKINN